MPSRVIRESYCRSRSLTKCSPDTQDRFPRFWLYPDDWGCFEIDIDVMKGWLYPLRHDVTPNDIARHLKEFEQNGMLFTWIEDQKKYGFFVNWFKHQSIREAKRHKRRTSSPPKDALAKYNAQFELPPSATNCQQLPENPYLNLNPNLNPKKTSCSRNSKPEFLERVEKLKSLILQNNPSAIVKPNDWANNVRLMVERDKRTLEQIDAVIEWSQGDDFEKTNVLSMGKLRHRFDSLTMKMKRAKRGRESNICPACHKPMADQGDHWFCSDCRQKYKKEA